MNHTSHLSTIVEAMYLHEPPMKSLEEAANTEGYFHLIDTTTAEENNKYLVCSLPTNDSRYQRLSKYNANVYSLKLWLMNQLH